MNLFSDNNKMYIQLLLKNAVHKQLSFLFLVSLSVTTQMQYAKSFLRSPILQYKLFWSHNPFMAVSIRKPLHLIKHKLLMTLL